MWTKDVNGLYPLSMCTTLPNSRHYRSWAPKSPTPKPSRPRRYLSWAPTWPSPPQNKKRRVSVQQLTDLVVEEAQRMSMWECVCECVRVCVCVCMGTCWSWPTFSIECVWGGGHLLVLTNVLDILLGYARFLHGSRRGDELAVESHSGVCVGVCVGVRVCVCVRVRACVCYASASILFGLNLWWVRNDKSRQSTKKKKYASRRTTACYKSEQELPKESVLAIINLFSISHYVRVLHISVIYLFAKNSWIWAPCFSRRDLFRALFSLRYLFGKSYSVSSLKSLYLPRRIENLDSFITLR